ncbi:MAG: TauD/TfdA family dioxygenase [Blastocatellia bacterium]|nr:TauD/TfdA family dioxygenase [Blastocatellia bacterium]
MAMKNVEDIYPLSPVQQGMLFHAVYDPKGGMYLEQKTCTLQGDLDVSAFERAWQAVVERHPVLRTAFVWQALDEPMQVVRRSVKLSWRREDWRGLSPEEQQAQSSAFLQADRTQGMDLSKAPLMRLALFRLADDAYQFTWTHHHILLDGWSLPILFKEVFAFYEAFRKGADLRLEKGRPYRDYIAWLQRQDLSQAEAFWRNELKGFTTPTPLWVSRNTSAGQKESYGEQSLALSEQETASLQSLAQRHQLTMNTLVQGAWGLLLSCYTGKKDVVFGATVSGRPADLAGVETMFGIFINTLPVRVQITPQLPLPSWLKELQAKQVEMRQYEYSPLAQIQSWSETPRGRPLFECILVYENYPVNIASEEEQSASIEIRNFRAQERGNYPLILKAAFARQRLSLGALYDTQVFDDAAIARLLNQLKAVLNGMVDQPETELGELAKIIKEAERRERVMEQRRRKEINLEGFRKVVPVTFSLSQAELIKTDYLQPGQTLPLVIEPAAEDVDLADWAKSNLEFIEAELLKHGGILFRGFGLNSTSAFEKFASAIRPDLFGEYGDLPREEGSKKVYQSTPYPENKTILFHNESSHMHRWPTKQWFYCMKPALVGGETPIVDCRKVYQRLDPRIVENFRRKKLRYVRNFHKGLDVSWQTFYGTDDRSKVERYLQAHSTEFEWTSKGGLRTYQVSPGVVRHPKTGEMCFFNQVQLHHVFFLDPALRRSVESLFELEEYPRNVYYGDGSPIEDSVMEEIQRVYWDTAVSFPWREGDVLMNDNMLVAHARNPYQGERKIVVAMAEMVAIDSVSESVRDSVRDSVLD